MTKNKKVVATKQPPQTEKKEVEANLDPKLVEQYHEQLSQVKEDTSRRSIGEYLKESVEKSENDDNLKFFLG